MYDLKTVGPAPAPAPDALGRDKAFKGIHISIPALIEASILTGMPIEGRHFTDCVITGPAVFAASPETRFDNCNFGDVGNSARNIFMIGAGTKAIGALSVAGCVFEGCLFNGIGLVGNESYVADFVAKLTVEDARA